jgi:ferredoxin-type protein NapH
MKITRLRGILALVLIVLICLGLLFPLGTGTFSAFGFSSIAAVCPLGILETMLTGGDLPLHPLLLLGSVVVAVLVFGKFFCAWGCPTPWIQRFFRSRKETTSASDEARGADVDGTSSACAGCHSGCAASRQALPPLGGARDGIRIDGRHLTLLGALLSCVLFGFPVFCLLCPIGLTAATIVGLWHLFQYNDATFGLLLFPAIIILELVVLRRWCARICPLSALTSLIANGNRLFRPQVDEQRCLRAQGVDCHVCVDVCPEQLDPHSPHLPECSKCHACAEHCPASAIRFPLFSTQKRASQDAPSSTQETSSEPSSPQ